MFETDSELFFNPLISLTVLMGMGYELRMRRAVAVSQNGKLPPTFCIANFRVWPESRGLGHEKGSAVGATDPSFRTLEPAYWQKRVAPE